jgi:flavin reductase (DIM6/NTAB) family NADH-FMN oxidoreductase RutF
VDEIKQTDYCGSITGAKENKAEVCKFEVFYGKLKTAPMVEQYPVNLECKVVHMLNLGTHDLIIGRVDEVYAAEKYVAADGKLDKSKLNLFILDPPNYMLPGNIIGKMMSLGKDLKSGG